MTNSIIDRRNVGRRGNNFGRRSGAGRRKVAGIGVPKQIERRKDKSRRGPVSYNRNSGYWLRFDRRHPGERRLWGPSTRRWRAWERRSTAADRRSIVPRLSTYWLGFDRRHLGERRSTAADRRSIVPRLSTQTNFDEQEQRMTIGNEEAKGPNADRRNEIAGTAQEQLQRDFIVTTPAVRRVVGGGSIAAARRTMHTTNIAEAAEFMRAWLNDVLDRRLNGGGRRMQAKRRCDE